MTDQKTTASTFVPFTMEELAALDTAHGDIREEKGAIPPLKPWRPEFKPDYPWQVVFRRPLAAETRLMEKMIHSDQGKSGAMFNFARTLVVGVSHRGVKTTCLDRADSASVERVRKAWDAMQEAEGGGIHMACQTSLMGLANAGREVEGKE